MTARPVLTRLMEKVDPTGPMFNGTPCWLWVGSVDGGNYGMIHLDGRTKRAHRVAYELFVGPIPAGLELDHLCRVRGCVNPKHLEAVTCRENTMRGDTITAAHASKTHCPQGHPYSGDNLYIHPRGGRQCRTCHRARNQRKGRRRAA